MPSAPSSDRKTAGKSSHLAHDTRNCLTVLRVYCDLLRSSGAIRSGYEPWMDELAGAIERGQKLVDTLLDSIHESDPHAFSPHGSALSPVADCRKGRSGLQDRGFVDVAAALRRRLPILERMGGDRIHVEIHAPSCAGMVQLSESDFERILYNLAGNAIEAMPQGGMLRISLRTGPFKAPCGGQLEAQGSAGTVSLCVADTGMGIDPDRLPHIFETGVTGKRKHADCPERHGFGLAIVRELTERAGGDVRVYSQPGSGSRFEVDLPAA